MTSATLRVHVTGKGDAENRSLVAEWYPASNWPIDGADWSLNSTASALPGADITGIVVGQVNSFSLTGLGNVSTTAFTALRLHVSGGQPAGVNYVQMASLEHATLPEAQLVINYTLDPPPPPTTLTVSVASGGDDGRVLVSGPSSAGYPPTGSPTVNLSELIPTRSLSSGNFNLNAGLLRFDTSALPDGATVTSATLRAHVISKSDGDNRSLVAEWYPASNWPIDGTDWSLNSTASALPGADVTGIVVGQVNSFSLTGLGNVSTTAFTALRLHVSGGQPAGVNYVQMASLEHATLPEAQLVLNYTVP